jgi:Cu-Zn family superoxide dismutase
MRSFPRTLVPVLAAALAAGCASGGAPAASAPPAPVVEAAPGVWAAISDAVAVAQPTKGSSVHGVVRFTDVADGVRVTAEFEGLKPNAKHAFHIHEFGDCTGTDGKSAGGHYNPEGHQHAGPDAPMHHAGDLGNIDADASGNARYERVISGLTIAGDHNPILGRSVVVHAGEDDLASQPAGNAGERVACGVIGVAKPPTK